MIFISIFLPSFKYLAKLIFCTVPVLFVVFHASVFAQSKFETELCKAAKGRNVIEMVYDRDKSKGCIARIVDVHQVAIGNNGQLYMHGYQHRGCTKAKDYPAERTFRFDKIKSVTIIDGEFTGKSVGIKDEGWDGCLGNNCFIEKNICE